MAKSIQDQITELKEQRSQAIVAQLPDSWEGVSLTEQRRRAALAENSEEVFALNEQIDHLRAQQLAERLNDDADPFDQVELTTTIDVLRGQNKNTLADLLAPLAEGGE